MVESPYRVVNEMTAARILIKEGTVTPRGLVLVLQNLSATDEIDWGHHHNLEISLEDKWYKVPVVVKNTGFIDSLERIGPLTSQERIADFAFRHGELKPGKYRVVLSCTQDLHSDYSIFKDMAAEFVIE